MGARFLQLPVIFLFFRSFCLLSTGDKKICSTDSNNVIPIRETNMDMPHIGISYEGNIPESTFSEFLDDVSNEKLLINVKSREQGGPHAGFEWLLPTMVVAYISKSYFDAFLKEMGKDHYLLLKKGLASLRARLVGEKAPEVTIISTPGKTNKANKYSFVFSIIAEAEEGQRFKLLIQEGVSEGEYARINDAFLTFLEQYHSGNLDKKMVEKLVSVNVVGGTLLLAFNDDIGELEPIDPRPKNINSNE